MQVWQASWREMLKKKSLSLRRTRKPKTCDTTSKQSSLTKYFHVMPKLSTPSKADVTEPSSTLIAIDSATDKTGLKRKLESPICKQNVKKTPKKLSDILVPSSASSCSLLSDRPKKTKRILFETSINREEEDVCDELEDVSGLFEGMDISLFDNEADNVLMQQSNSTVHQLPELCVVKSVLKQELIVSNRGWNEELIVQLSLNTSNFECCLRDIWSVEDDRSQTDIKQGDVVHLIGDLMNPATPLYKEPVNNNRVIISGNNNSAIIINPDYLISSTSIAGHGISCTRRAVLNEIYKGSLRVNEYLLFGNILHCVFQKTIQVHDSGITEAIVRQNIADILSTSSILHQMYSMSLTDEYVRDKVNSFIPAVLKWCQKYLQSDARMEAQEYWNQPDKQTITVSTVRDIEENVWSPRFGLKGKIDATVELKQVTGSCHSNITPLEVKTGKMFNKMGSIEHRAQVMLYCLMLSDVHNTNITSGLLYYMKESHTQLVPAAPNEIQALLVARNHLARYHGNHWDHVNFPEMIQEQYTCRYCPLLKQCTLHYRSFENGKAELSYLGEYFPNCIRNMSESRIEFFQHWYKLVSKELSHCEEKIITGGQIWRTTLQEREKDGSCISNLIALPLDTTLTKGMGGFDVKQKFKRSSSPMTNNHISVTNRIVVSIQGHQWGLALGYVQAIDSKQLTLLLDRGVPSNDTLYCIDLRATDQVGEGLGLNNLVNLCSSDEERDSRLQQLIIDLDKPVFNSSYTSNSVIDNILADLSCHQRKAVLRMLLANDYSLLLGMPGTGKTSTITQLIRIFTAMGKTTLLSSFTNSAVDNVLLRLIDVGIDFVRVGTRQKVHSSIIPYTTEEIANNVNNIHELRHRYNNKSVIASTCHGIVHSVITDRMFDYCIIDEAGQIPFPLSIGPLRLAKVFILVGDNYQLPPLVTSPVARAEGYDLSLFKLLSETHPESLVYLTRQYRMNREIMELCNVLIYNGQLECASDDVAMATLKVLHWNTADIKIKWLNDAINPSNPIVFLDTDKCGDNLERRVGSHIINPFEIDQVCLLVQTLIKCGVSSENIMVITQYKHQQQLIFDCLNEELSDNSTIEVLTVDKCQGKDKECVIVSFVRSNNEQKVGNLLTNWQRINVALTRAKHKLLMIGSCRTLQNSECLHKMIKLLRNGSKITDIIQ